MISARTSREPSIHTAVLVRVTAFLVAAASVVIIPVEFCAAANGHEAVPTAFAVVAAAALLTLATTIAARSLDPLRR